MSSKRKAGLSAAGRAAIAYAGLSAMRLAREDIRAAKAGLSKAVKAMAGASKKKRPK